MQHDFDLANQTGALFRADLNLALAAIISQSSGLTEPTVKSAFQFWMDTTTGLLKIRNSGNSAWVVLGTAASANLGLLSLAGGTMTGALLAAVGLVGTPGIAWSGDADTGAYWISANTWALVSNGVAIMQISPTGIAMLGTGATTLPAGTTAQRPTPAVGMVRYNSDTSKIEGYAASSWQSLGGVSPLSVTAVKVANYTITSADDVTRVGTSGSDWNLTLADPTLVPGQVFEIVQTDSAYSGKTITIIGTIVGSNGAETDWALHTPGERYRIVSNGTNYNLLEHNTNTGFFASANITFTGTTTNPTKGTNTTDSIKFKRQGRFAFVFVKYVQTGAGGAGSGNYLITLPNSLVADSAHLVANASTDYSTSAGYSLIDSVMGVGVATVAGITGWAALYSTTTFKIIGATAAGSTAAWGNSSISMANATLGVVGWLRVPIANWKD